jgi:hypothetical protein
MTWYLKLFFLAAAALSIWGGFVRPQILYPFARTEQESQALVWLGRVETGLLAVFLISWALLK